MPDIPGSRSRRLTRDEVRAICNEGTRCFPDPAETERSLALLCLRLLDVEREASAFLGSLVRHPGEGTPLWIHNVHFSRTHDAITRSGGSPPRLYTGWESEE